MASVPFHCEKCNTRRSPSEPISALGNLAVGLCCVPKKENLNALYEALKEPVLKPLSDSNDYDTFVDNGWIPASEQAWRTSKAYGHSSLDGLHYIYISSLCKAVLRSPFNGGPGIVWVIFGKWTFSKEVFWRIYFTSPFTTEFTTSSENRGFGKTSHGQDLNTYLKDEY